MLFEPSCHASPLWILHNVPSEKGKRRQVWARLSISRCQSKRNLIFLRETASLLGSQLCTYTPKSGFSLLDIPWEKEKTIRAWQTRELLIHRESVSNSNLQSNNNQPLTQHNVSSAESLPLSPLTANAPGQTLLQFQDPQPQHKPSSTSSTADSIHVITHIILFMNEL